jgi:hypothetical protein
MWNIPWIYAFSGTGCRSWELLSLIRRNKLINIKRIYNKNRMFIIITLILTVAILLHSVNKLTGSAANRASIFRTLSHKKEKFRRFSADLIRAQMKDFLLNKMFLTNNSNKLIYGWIGLGSSSYVQYYYDLLLRVLRDKKFGFWAIIFFYFFLLSYIIFSNMISIVVILYGDHLIKKYKLEEKYPKLAKWIELRRRLQRYALIISIGYMTSITSTSLILCVARPLI